jgi:hypothetical protein
MMTVITSVTVDTLDPSTDSGHTVLRVWLRAPAAQAAFPVTDRPTAVPTERNLCWLSSSQRTVNLKITLPGKMRYDECNSEMRFAAIGELPLAILLLRAVTRLPKFHPLRLPPAATAQRSEARLSCAAALSSAQQQSVTKQSQSAEVKHSTKAQQHHECYNSAASRV